MQDLFLNGFLYLLLCYVDGEGDPGVADSPAGAGEGERAL